MEGGQDTQKQRAPSPSSLSGPQASCPHTGRAEGLQGDGPRLSTCCKGQWSSHSRPGKRINTTSSVVRGREDHLNLNSDLSTTSSHSRKSPCSLGKPGTQVALPPAGLPEAGAAPPLPTPLGSSSEPCWVSRQARRGALHQTRMWRPFASQGHQPRGPPPPLLARWLLSPRPHRREGKRCKHGSW